MRLLMIIIVLAAIGVGIYHFSAQKDSEAFSTYKQFADNKTRFYWDQALTLVGGDDARLEIAQEKARWDMVGTTSLGTILEITYRLESETAAASGGEVQLQLVQDVRLNPPGMNSTFGRIVPHRHTATMKRISGAWKVLAYTDTVINQSR